MQVAECNHALLRVQGCTFAFQSIEYFSIILACFFGPKGKVDANIYRARGHYIMVDYAKPQFKHRELGG